MRQETIKIYQFDELSDDAKEHAIESYRDQGYPYEWSDEWLDSLKGFCDEFDITLTDYSVGPYSHSYIRYSLPGYDFEPDELVGLRLRKWLINNHSDILYQGKYIKSVVDDIPHGKKYPFSTKRALLRHGDNAGKYCVSLYSRINIQQHCCPFTGVGGDESLLTPIRKFLAKPDPHMDLESLINNCMDSFISEWVSDMEYQDSDEYITETLTTTDNEFTEDGDLY